jgi:DNA invertase Pin-like site-specific DNA recombinase
MVFRMLAVLSEFERDLVSERTRAALSHKRANGYKTGGEVPYGYNVRKDGRLTKNPREQRSICLICGFREKGHSLRSIAAELDQRGVKSKKGRNWNAMSVKAVLDRAIKP